MLPLDRFSALVGRIYGAGSGAEAWPTVLKELADLLGAMNATIWYMDAEGRFPAHHSSAGIEQAVLDYAAHYGRLDPVRAEVLRRPAGVPITNDMALPRSELVRTEFYNDFGRRHGMEGALQAYAFRDPTAAGFFAAARPPHQDAFGREQVELVALLLPHLARAMRVELKLRTAGVGRDATADLLASRAGAPPDAA